MAQPCRVSIAVRSLLVVLLGAGLAPAGEPTIVKDIVPGALSSYPAYPMALGDRLLFWTQYGPTQTLDYALWSSDGTGAGTVLLEDFADATYVYYGRPYYQTLLGNVMIFWTYDLATGYVLWRTDGTEAGTYFLKDLDPTGPYGYPQSTFTTFGNNVVFSVYSGTGYELWTTDGTVAGTAKIGASGSYYYYYQTLLGNVLLYWAYDTTNGYVLWRTDGTAAGTFALADADPTGLYGYPQSTFTLAGNAVLFYVYQSNGYRALWRSDGTVAGTSMLKDRVYNSYEVVSANLHLFWVNDTTSGYVLWRTDGTAAGTFALADTDPSGVNGYPVSNFTPLGNAIAFTVYTASGYALWRTDGTVAGTVKLSSSGAYYYNQTLLGNVLLYWAYDTTNGYVLWRTDGTAAGTFLVKDMDPTGLNGYPQGNFIPFGNILVFSIYKGTGYELWRTDGTTVGTFRLAPTATAYYNYYSAVAGNTLFFWTYQTTNGYVLWRTDGTEAGTFALKDFDPTGLYGYPGIIVSAGNLLLFSVYIPAIGYEAWMSDGTVAGTVRLKEGNSYLTGGVAVGAGRFFSVYDYASGSYETWLTDGTIAGTGRLDVGYFYAGAAVGGRYLFSTYDTSGNSSFWLTDGTRVGTVRIGAGQAVVPVPTMLGGALLFMRYDATTGLYELWRTDGTVAGTYRLAQGTTYYYYYYYYYGYNYYSYLAGDTLTFSTYDAANGWTLLRTDGSAAGTALLKSGYNGVPTYFTPVGDIVFFVASQPATGYELWRTDGEVAAQQAPEPPAPPSFTSPTEPASGSSFTWAAGKTLTLELSAFDPNEDDDVTLRALSLPPGATLTPSLPTVGNPASSTFSWTPMPSDTGAHVIEFAASDGAEEVTWKITVTVNFDSDGDGLPDLWETPPPLGDGGYTLNGVFIDLVAMGAKPRRKDVFVEIDYMADATRSQKPLQTAVDRIVAMFANAPVANPDGSTGISLHVHCDDAVPWSDTLGTSTAAGYDWSAFDTIKGSYFEEALALSTHYCLFANRLPNGISGLSRGNGAADFIVSLGGLPATFNREWAEAGTFAHELGHNMGLMHGGMDDIRQKPNYLSVMNLPFQLRGLRRNGQDGFFDYSREALPNLNEMSLDETSPLAPSTSGLQTTYWVGTQRWTGVLPSAIDWNGNGTTTAGAVADVNNDFTGSVLRGWNDWANLNYTGGSLGAGVVLPEPEATEIEQELDEVEAQEIRPAAPTGVTARANPGSIRVAWNTCGVGSSYCVYRCVGNEAPAKIGTTGQALYTDTAVTKGVTYKYYVTVINGAESDPSATATATAR